MRKVYGVLIPTVGVYCLLLVLFPRFLLKLAYRNEYADAESVSILTLYSICAFLSYLQMGVVAALTAARKTRHVFLGSVWGCVIAVMPARCSFTRSGQRLDREYHACDHRGDDCLCHRCKKNLSPTRVAAPFEDHHGGTERF
jgi:hypothetical protein